MNKRVKTILFVLIATTLFVSGQNKADSLLNCLQTMQNNGDKIKVLHQLTIEHRDVDPDVAMEYGLQALGIGRELEYTPHIALSLKHLGIVARKQGQYKQALNYFNEALELFEKKQLQDGVLDCLNGIATVYLVQNDYNKATEYYEKVAEFWLKHRTHKFSCAKAFNNAAIVFLNQGEYSKSLKFGNLALSLYADLKKEDNMANCYNNMAMVYRRQEMYKKALELYGHSLTIWKKKGHKRGIGRVLNNMGYVYMGQGNHSKAMKYHKKALAIRRTLNFETDIVSSLQSVGSLHYNKGQYDKAMKYFQESLSMGENILDQRDLAELLNDIGKVYLKKGKHHEAIKHCERSLSIAEKIKAYPDIINACKTLEIIYQETGDTKNTVKYREKTEEAESEQQALEAQEAFVKDREHLTKLVEELQESNKRKQFVIWLIVGLAVVLILASLFLILFIVKKYKKKISNILADMDERVRDLADFRLTLNKVAKDYHEEEERKDPKIIRLDPD